jgi:hypothetical protein
MPISKDIYDGALVLEGLAQVYAWSGDRDRAIELVQKLLMMPGYTNYGRLKLHPLWDPLRGDPRFEKIVASLAPKESASPRSRRKNLRPPPNESRKLFLRAKATQCLSGCSRLRRGRMVSYPTHNAGLPIF